MTQEDALKILKMGHNVYLTGAAGSGKTYTLRNYISYLKEHGIGTAITASTGIAATHLGGMTIHSWSGLGIRDYMREEEIEELQERQYLWKRYENTKVLIIDEISMLHHFRFDLLDKVCRAFKRNDIPFGGLQVILCGDFFQLPPVTRLGELPAYFVYRSNVWQEMNLKICYISEQHRQSDMTFLSVLNDIRNNNVSEDTLAHLESRYMKELGGKISPTKLYTHNENVDRINDQELTNLKAGAEKTYLMTSRGKPGIVETLKKTCLAPEKLVLKTGARVMFVKNNFDKKYVNGTLGEVKSFDDSGFPIIKIGNGSLIGAEPQSWRIEENGKILAEISQIPLRLAWAITVHKSQGMSLDAAEIDLSKSFVPGMGYVALSRVRSLNGLRLVGFNQNALEVHPEICEIDKTFMQKSEECVSMLEVLGHSEIIKRQEEFVRINSDAKKKNKNNEADLPTHKKTKMLLQSGLTLREIALERNLKIDTIIDHIEKLIKEGEDLDLSDLKKEAFTEKKYEKIKAAFKTSVALCGDYRLAPVKSKLGGGYSYDDIRLARVFIQNEARNEIDEL